MSQLLRMETPEEAIEAACTLLDEGGEVSGLGMGPLANSIDQDQIARIYEIWARAAPLRQMDGVKLTH
jgi:hypothetical protein